MIAHLRVVIDEAVSFRAAIRPVLDSLGIETHTR
jgi:hypothetical protein